MSRGKVGGGESRPLDDTPRDPQTLLDAVNNPQIPDHAILKNTTLGEVRATLDATRPSGDLVDITGLDAIEAALIERLTAEGWTRPSGDDPLRAALKEARDYLASGSGVIGVIAFIDRALATPSSAPDRHAGEATAPIYHLPSAPDDTPWLGPEYAAALADHLGMESSAPDVEGLNCAECGLGRGDMIHTDIGHDDLHDYRDTRS